MCVEDLQAMSCLDPGGPGRRSGDGRGKQEGRDSGPHHRSSFSGTGLQNSSPSPAQLFLHATKLAPARPHSPSPV